MSRGRARNLRRQPFSKILHHAKTTTNPGKLNGIATGICMKFWSVDAYTCRELIETVAFMQPNEKYRTQLPVGHTFLWGWIDFSGEKLTCCIVHNLACALATLPTKELIINILMKKTPNSEAISCEFK
ncbi:hypothetical protein AVEN_106729-1 [Araneus ventricosus]|uniref:Uncharacterized protein n=1 Tax=Araneus ventricosus TaxID=182803 RepID=A0A4Y2F2F6_ARAVE|nr:hypothetical protein AVEN_106729-1 [Araneus ventricosus]